MRISKFTAIAPLLAITLSNCTVQQPEESFAQRAFKGDPTKFDEVAYKEEQAAYVACVVGRAIEFYSASEDIKLIVATAKRGCSLAGVSDVLEKAEFGPALVLTGLSFTQSDAETLVTEVLLKLRSKQHITSE